MKPVYYLISNFVFVFAFGSMSFAVAPQSNGGRGGGSVIKTELASVAEIQNAVTESSVFIRAWLQGVEGQIYPDIGLHGQPRRQLLLPKGVEKLFGRSLDNVYRHLDQLKIVYKTKAACALKKIQEKDGSVVSAKEDKICISGFLLSQKLNKLDYILQTEALILHELSHIMGATEVEATSIQQQYLFDMIGVSKEFLLKAIEQKSDFFTSIAYSLPKLSHYFDDTEKFCEVLLNTRTYVSENVLDVPISAISVYTVEQRDQIDEMQVVIGQMWHLFVCSQNPKLPIKAWLEEYNNAFAGKSRIQVREWMINRGSKGVKPSNLSLSVDKLNKNSDLKETFANFAELFQSLGWQISSTSLLRPTLTIDDGLR